MSGSNKNWKSQFFIPKGYNLDIVNKVVIKGKEFLPERHGKWIMCGTYRGLSIQKCSECEKIEHRMSNYCPNCGAKMDKEGKENALD